MHNAKAAVTTERQAVTVRSDAETKTAVERAELRQAVRAIDDALDTTRVERVRQSLHDHARSRLGQLLGPAPADLRSRAAWYAIADRIETALDDPADRARLRWSKNPLDRLTHGLLDGDPTAVTQAQRIIADIGAAVERPIRLGAPARREQTTRVRAGTVHPAHVDRCRNNLPGLGL